jgi:hypothetical protein
MPLSKQEIDSKYSVMYETVDDSHIRMKIGDNDWVTKENCTKLLYRDIDLGDRYTIDINGKVLDTTNGNKLLHYSTSEGLTCRLKDVNGKKRELKVIWLLYFSFVCIIPKGLIFRFKDDNKKNISLNNIDIRTSLDKKITVTENLENARQVKGYPNYYMFEDTRIYSVLNQKYLVPEKMEKYYRIRLSDGKKYKRFYLHRLVYETFIGDIDEGKVVDHIDGNTFNNHPSNLQQLTHSENIKKRDLTKKHIYQYKVNKYGNTDLVMFYDDYDDLTRRFPEYDINLIKPIINTQNTAYGCYWKDKKFTLRIKNLKELELENYKPLNTLDGRTYKNKDYIISDRGKIVAKSTLCVLKPTLREKYFNVALLDDEGNDFSRQVHTLVGLTFLTNEYLEIIKKVPKPIINHKNEIRHDNRLENLEWLSTRYNTIYSRGTKVCQIDLITKIIIHIFLSETEVADFCGKKTVRDTLHSVCKSRREYNGFLWKFYNDGDVVGNIVDWNNLPNLVSDMNNLNIDENEKEEQNIIYNDEDDEEEDDIITESKENIDKNEKEKNIDIYYTFYK